MTAYDPGTTEPAAHCDVTCSSVWVFGFRVSGCGLRVSGFGFEVLISGFGFGVLISGFGFRDSGFGFRVQG